MLRRIVIILLSVLLVIAIVTAGFGFYTVRHSFPQTSGQIHVAGLNGPVDIYRDTYGVPQIYAANQHDLFFAQGYVHAQDRFWQMDFWRHIGSARLSEMFGASTLDQDKFLRTLQLTKVVDSELAVMDPDSKAILQAYADGVNAYLAGHQGSALSLEYAILKLTNSSYKPEPWLPLNSLTWAKMMAYDLGGNMDGEIERAILSKSLTPQQLAEIVPPYPSDGPIIVPTHNIATDTQGSSSITPALNDGTVSALKGILAQSTSLQSLLGPREAGIGSNNWVISGQLTSTGKPLLANDPHLSAQMPSIWYEVGLHCVPKGPDCPYNVTGFSFASTPGVIIGHNDRIAWGVTNVGPDVQDLYIEKINPENPNQYEVNGKWVDMQVTNEILNVAGGQPAPLTVRWTRHGPIISETYGNLKDGSQVTGSAIALRWTALDPAFTFRAVWKLDRAENWDDFREALRDFTVPAQNFIYADVDGNIGYQTPGNIPIRAKGDGTMPVPGWTDEYEWTGMIPFEQLPFAYNPPQGYIATANNAVVGPNYPHLITMDWDYGFRARRIVELIEHAPEPIDVAYIKTMQGDDKDLNAQTLAPILLQIQLNDDRLEKARTLLQNWDYQDQMDSAPAALFAVFWKHLLADAFDDQLPEAYWPSGDSQWFEVLRHLATQPDSPWWDNVTTSTVETRDQVFAQALSEAVDELEKAQGKDPNKWKWGDLHTLTFQNQTLGKSGIGPIEAIFNRGPFRTSGGGSIVNATGWDATKSYEVRWLPSMRMIVDLSNLANSLTIHTTGESGHAYNPHYIDMADLWRNIQYAPMLWEQDQIQKAQGGHLNMAP